MKFSVIIPTCHRNDLLALCLERLAPGAQSLPPEHYEVIVTDDGSTTTAETMIREQFPWARWVVGPRRGPAANRNNGAKHANGEWLVFTDDDCLPAYGWLEAYENNLNKAWVLEGLTRADRPKRSLDEESPINLTGGYLWSCNLAIMRSFFFELEGFDEKFPAPAMEDCDLRERIKGIGQAFVFCPDAEVIHPWRPIKDGIFYKKYLLAYAYFTKKHPHLKPAHPHFHHIKSSVRSYIKILVKESWRMSFRGQKRITQNFGLAIFENIKSGLLGR